MTDEEPGGRRLNVAFAAGLLALAGVAATAPESHAGEGASPLAPEAPEPTPARYPPPGIAAGAVLRHPLGEGLALRVEVPAEEPANGGTVELVIFEEGPGGLILSRLSTRRVGQLRNSWRTDLDDDDAPEYLLAFAPPTQAAGEGAPELLQLWEWQADAHAFVRMELPPLETTSPVLERHLVVDDDTLEWQVVLEEEDGEREEASYRLDPDDARWERRRGWLRWPL